MPQGLDIFFVTPAKGGVHDLPTNWIPASAGKTFSCLLAIEPSACD